VRELVWRAHTHQANNHGQGRTHTRPTYYSNIFIEDNVDFGLEWEQSAQGDFLELCTPTPEVAWILDLDCSQHVNNNREQFSNLKISPSSIMIQTAKKQLLPMKGKGTVHIGSNNEINIHDVYFVLGLSFNLLSVGAIMDLELTVVFDNKQCIVYQGPNNVVGCGQHNLKTGLYIYIMPNSKFHVCTTTLSIIAQLWHK